MRVSNDIAKCNSLQMSTNDVALAVHRPQAGTNAVALRRAMLGVPAVMDALTPVEKAVFLATTDIPFSEYEDGALFGAMVDALKWIATDIGIRDTGSETWKMSNVRIAQIVKRYYPGYTIKDVKMAFEMTVTGEINEFFPKDRNGNPEKDHYQMFTVDYFCKVMNAYRQKRKQVLQKATEAVPRPEDVPNAKRDAYYRNLTRREAIWAFIRYKYHGYINLSAIDEMLVYDLLAKVGLAEPVVVTDQERHAILRETLNDASRLMTAEKERLKNVGIKAEQIQTPAFILARTKALKDTFDWMITEGVQITNYIKME